MFFDLVEAVRTEFKFRLGEGRSKGQQAKGLVTRIDPSRRNATRGSGWTTQDLTDKEREQAPAYVKMKKIQRYTVGPKSATDPKDPLAKKAKMTPGERRSEMKATARKRRYDIRDRKERQR